jgi:hypothetical protein
MRVSRVTRPFPSMVRRARLRSAGIATVTESALPMMPT